MVLNKKKHILFAISIGLLLVSCTNSDNEDQNSFSGSENNRQFSHVNEVLPIDDFVSFVKNEENDLVKEKQVSDIKFRMSFMPKECLAYLELKSDTENVNKLKETIKHYEGMSYFNLRLELESGEGELLKHNLSSAMQYEARVRYLSFEIQKDIFLIQGNDTISPGMYHFERIYEVAPYATIMLAFDDAKFKKDQDFTIVYNDKLFNKGLIKYYYKQNQLIDLPKISGV